MAIVMPGEDELPAGPRRDLVATIHTLYSDAGRPGTRTMAKAIAKDNTLPATVSHETLAGLLPGRTVPEWPRLHAAVQHLAGASFRPTADPGETVARFHALWLAERDSPRPKGPLPDATAAPPVVELPPSARLPAGDSAAPGSCPHSAAGRAVQPGRTAGSHRRAGRVRHHRFAAAGQRFAVHAGDLQPVKAPRPDGRSGGAQAALKRPSGDPDVQRVRERA